MSNPTQTTHLGYGWLHCLVSRGLWPHEYSIVIDFQLGGKQKKFTSWAHKSDVKVEREPNPNELIGGLVRVLASREEQGLLTVILPHETFNSGPVVVVPSSLFSFGMF